MVSALLLAASILRKKEEQQEVLSRYDANNLPALLVESLTREVGEKVYEEATRLYNEEKIDFARTYVAAVPPETLGHSDINCITSESAYPALCGFTFLEFDRLFHSLQRPLAILFPRSPSHAIAGRVHPYATRRMKLFLFLFRCKLGTSFLQLEGIFGWSKTAICRWFELLAFSFYFTLYRPIRQKIYFESKSVSW